MLFFVCSKRCRIQPVKLETSCTDGERSQEKRVEEVNQRDLSEVNQRDGIYRVGILEHFLPKSKQTPKPLISKES